MVTTTAAGNTPRSPVRFGYAEYALLPPDRNRWEVVDGDFKVNPAPTSMHQVISGRLLRALMNKLEVPGRNVVFHAPFDVILDAHNIVQPDLVVVTAARRDRISERGLEGAPDIAIEILSRNRAHDEVLKRALYEKFGVPEYWMVDGDAHLVTHLVLRDGRYTTHAILREADTLVSTLFDGELRLPLAPLFAPL